MDLRCENKKDMLLTEKPIKGRGLGPI